MTNLQVGHQRRPHSLCGDRGAAPPETPMGIAGNVWKMVVHQMREQGMLTTTSPTSERECGGKVWGNLALNQKPRFCMKQWGPV